MARYDWITFLTDYGLRDSYVGVCHGVMARIAPHARVIDLSHAVGRQDVRQGGQVLVGPDNGLLVWAADALGGTRRAHALANPDYQLSPVSRTFHGRDVFAPAAAHLAAGLDLSALGPELDPAGLVRLPVPTATVDGDRLVAEVVSVDHFGNLLLSFGHAELERAGLHLGDPVEIRVGDRSFGAAVGETFATVPAGALVVHEDSSRRIAISLNRGRAAERLRVRTGDRVVLSRSGR